MLIALFLLLFVAPVPADDPMLGAWKADLTASTLPEGFPKLRSQTMVLQLISGKLRCSTERVSLDGTKTQADFTAPFDGKRYPVTGMPEIASVSLHRYRTFIEADFYSEQVPIYSYRMSISSRDGTLIIISIDPVTRIPLHARIVYRREPAAMIGLLFENGRKRKFSQIASNGSTSCQRATVTLSIPQRGHRQTSSTTNALPQTGHTRSFAG
jgi:hypothetical protein